MIVPCRSCKAPIVWARTINDKPMPVDAQPAPDGNVLLHEPGPTAEVLAGLFLAAARDQGLELHMPHHSTCPDGEKWRRRDYDRDRRRRQRRPDEAALRKLVPAGPVRRHLLDLVAHGASLRSVAAAAVVSPSTISRLARGELRTVRRHIREAIYAFIPPSDVASADRLSEGPQEAYDDYEDLISALAQVVEDRRAPWRARAACRHPGITVDVFYVGRGEAPDQARRVCAVCPVILDCADYADAHHEQVGMWAGMAPKDRRPGRGREDVA